jgi:hypothetical protein
MRNLRRRAAVALIASALTAGPAHAEEREGTKREPQTYESPLVSLLFLPVTLLVKMASVFRPEPNAPEERSAGTPRD